MVSAESSLKPSVHKQKPRQAYLFHKADWTTLKSKMKQYQESFMSTCSEKSVEELWYDFTSTLNQLCKESIPSKLIRGKPSLPWITQEIKRLIRKRDSLYSQSKKSNEEDIKHQFKALRQKIKKKIKILYERYLNDLLGLSESNKTCDKKLFSFLKSSRQDQEGIPPLKDNDILLTETPAKANLCNQQFQSVFTKKSPLSLSRLAQMKVQDLVDEGSIPPESIPDPYLNSTPVMPDIDISLNGLLKLMKNLKPGKAAGPDKLKPLLLKELRDEIAPIIKVIFDKSLQTGTLPTEWLTANVMPVFKKGDKSLAANYRPISLTCILCKVLEHILASNIVKHLDAQEIMYDMQHGFREKRSCETQLVMMIEDLAGNASAGNQTDVILLDFSKAFDKVSHSKLLWKLHQYGIRGKVLGWIQAFLGNRSQQVVIDGEESNSIPVNSGVPQGSVLGPILFLAYINDLPGGISQVRLFADDTALYLTIKGEEDSSALQKDLDTLLVWESKWDMQFNPSKCQVVQVTGSKSKKPINSEYILHGQVLETVTCARYLGVDVSSTLSWNSHIDRVVNNANRTLGYIRRNIKCQNTDVRESAYNTLVRYQLEYASAVWDPHTKERISKTEIVQRRAARWTLRNFDHQASVTEMINKLGWRTLEQRRADARLCLFYKIVYGLVAVPLPDHVQYSHRISRYCHSMTFRQVYTSRDYYKYSFYPLAIVQWNALPESVVCLQSLDAFKAAICKLQHSRP